MTLEDLIALQAKLGLTDVHLVWIGETGFAIAHTDAERKLASSPLEDCSLHQELLSLNGPPRPLGIWKTQGFIWTKLDSSSVFP